MPLRTRNREAAPAPWKARLRFLLVFGLIALCLLAVYQFPYPEGSVPHRAIGAYLRAYARLAGAAIQVFDRKVSVSGLVVAGRFPLEIDLSCDAGDAMALVVAAVLAFPALWWRRALGIDLGMAAVALINIVRICSLYFIGIASPKAFDMVHHDVWPLGIILVSAAVFVLWARWAQRGWRADPART